jgi:hypothetical protein
MVASSRLSSRVKAPHSNMKNTRDHADKAKPGRGENPPDGVSKAGRPAGTPGKSTQNATPDPGPLRRSETRKPGRGAFCAIDTVPARWVEGRDGVPLLTNLSDAELAARVHDDVLESWPWVEAFKREP